LKRLLVLFSLMLFTYAGYTQLPLLHIDQPYELLNYQVKENFEISWSQKGKDKNKIFYVFNEQGYIEDWIVMKYDKKEKAYLIEIEVHREYIYNDSNKPIEVKISKKLYLENNISVTYFVDSLIYSLNREEIFHMDSTRHIFTKTQVDYSNWTEGSKIEVRTSICVDCSYSRQLYYFNTDGALIKYYTEKGSSHIAQTSVRHLMDWKSKKKVISKVSKDKHNSSEVKNLNNQKRVYKFNEEGMIKKCIVKSRGSAGGRSKLVIRINMNLEK
jgi:hypothetical protein